MGQKEYHLKQDKNKTKSIRIHTYTHTLRYKDSKELLARVGRPYQVSFTYEL